MTPRFLQLHLLTAYPPANLNRDDLGRPKTAVVGGANRLRVSSQSLKRAWRQSEVFEHALGGHKGTRTKERGLGVYKRFIDKGIEPSEAERWAHAIARQFGKPQGDPASGKTRQRGKAKGQPEDTDPTTQRPSSVLIEQVAHFGPAEDQAIDALVERCIERGSGPDEDELSLLRHPSEAADIALFGRMLAANPRYNVDASVQVAHAITTHKVAVDDDFFTAVDDLNTGEEDQGAGHMGETEFGSGLFYTYLCVNRAHLCETNLEGDTDLADKTLAALVEAACTVSPTGKQNAFGSRSRATFALAELGDAQPRSLATAFFQPVAGDDLITRSIEALEQTRRHFDAIYGDAPTQSRSFDVTRGEGQLQDLIDLARA